MPVFLFTIHAYRSWNADNPRGYVRQGEGILPPDEAQAKAYNHAAEESPAIFAPLQQDTIAWISWDVCEQRGWRLHGIALEPTHVHLLVSWQDETPMREVCRKLKNLMSRELNLHAMTKRRWLSRGASRKQVKDREHFEHLVERYLPKHRGVVWLEGMLPPEPPASAGG